MRSVFLLLTLPLYVGGLVGSVALKTYLSDAVSADEYAQRQSRDDDDDDDDDTSSFQPRSTSTTRGLSPRKSL
jgi:hypothetical protein